MTLFRNLLALFTRSYSDDYELVSRRTRGKVQIDEEKYLGKGFEMLLKDYPNANILSASYDRRDPIQVEVKLKEGTLTMQFNDFVCDLVEYFVDDQDA